MAALSIINNQYRKRLIWAMTISIQEKVKQDGFHYVAYGLYIQSEIELRGLTLYDGRSGNVEPDVSIVNGSVPESIENPVRSHPAFQAKPGVFLLKVRGIARYLVCDGKRIVVERMPGKTDGEIDVFLMCSVFGALFYQRGLLPLHAGAIRVGDKCALFAGESGAGKSTTVTAFLKRGYKLHADDLSVISPSRRDSAPVPLVWPAMPQMKLWVDSLEQAGGPSSQYEKQLPGREKYLVPRVGDFNRQPLLVGKIYVLSKKSEEPVSLENVTGISKFYPLLRNTYRSQYLAALGVKEEHFNSLGQIAERIPVAYVHRPRDYSNLDEVVDFIERDFSTWSA